jgi:hypothetical protein
MSSNSKGILFFLVTVCLLTIQLSCAAAPPPEPAPAAPSAFTTPISISSDPSGVAIYGNGEFWGKTPYGGTINWMSREQNIELRFEATGYMTERRMITPNQTTVHVVLQPNASAPR